MTLRVVLGLAVLLAATSAYAEEPAALGKKLFVEQGCYGCHTVGGSGTPIAPDLSRVGSKYSGSYLQRWLGDPSAQRPTAHMPKISLTEAEVRALAAYLESLQ